MPIREAQKKALRKYKEKTYDRLEISVAKGKKAILQAHASERSESLNGFVNRAIDETMERDNRTPEPEVTATYDKPTTNGSLSGNKSETDREQASQSKPAGKPTKELVETWLRLSDSGIGSPSISAMPEGGGYTQSTIRKYVRLARKAQG